MKSSKDQFLEMREAEQGINMEWSAPKEKVKIYTKEDLYKAANYGHDFGSTVAYTIKYDTIEDMINDLMIKP